MNRNLQEIVKELHYFSLYQTLEIKSSKAKKKKTIAFTKANVTRLLTTKKTKQKEQMKVFQKNKAQ